MSTAMRTGDGNLKIAGCDSQRVSNYKINIKI